MDSSAGTSTAVSTGRSNDTITNHGDMIGGSAGVTTSDGDDTLTNTGTIRVGNAARNTIADSAATMALGNDTVINSGILRSLNAANGGKTVEMGSGDDIFEVRAGSQIFSDAGTTVGGVNGGDDTDTLRFGGTTAQNFDLGRIGANTNQFHNFEQFQVIAGQTTFAGTTDVTFDVNGGTLAGTGTFGGLNINGGGTIAPGNSIGTTNVMGNVAFAANSIYNAELAADGTSDLIKATGTTNINGGEVQVSFTDPEGDYTDGERYTILTSTGGVTGTFASITDQSALIDTSLSYDANNVFVTLAIQQASNGAPNFPAFASTGNQQGIANALVGFDFTNDGDIRSALLGLNADGLRDAYNALAGEDHAVGQSAANNAGAHFGGLLGNRTVGSGSGQTFALGTVAAQDAGQAGLSVEQVAAFYASGQSARSDSFKFDGSNGGTDQTASGDVQKGIYAADVLVDEAPEAGPLGPSVWLSGLGGYTEVESDGNASGFDGYALGTAGGLETVWNGMTIGAGLGYSYSHFDLNDRTQQGDADNYHLGVYASGGAARLEEGIAWRMAGSYTHHAFNTERTIAFGAINRVASADYDGHTLTGFGEARYNMAIDGLPGRTILAPLARIDVAHSHTDGFTETGAGALNLTVADQDLAKTWLGAGLAVSGDYQIGTFNWRPNFTLAYERNVGDDQASVTSTLAGSATAFTTAGPKTGRDRLRFTSASAFALSETADLTFATSSTWADRQVDWTGSATLKLRF